MLLINVTNIYKYYKIITLYLNILHKFNIKYIHFIMYYI